MSLSPMRRAMAAPLLLAIGLSLLPTTQATASPGSCNNFLRVRVFTQGGMRIGYMRHAADRFWRLCEEDLERRRREEDKRDHWKELVADASPASNVHCGFMHLLGADGDGNPDPLQGRNLLYLDRLTRPGDPTRWCVHPKTYPGLRLTRKNQLVVGDSLSELTHEGKSLVRYLTYSIIDLDTVTMIQVDSMLWTEFEQERWVDPATAALFRNRKIVFAEQWGTTDGSDYWVDFVSFDSSWTKRRFLKHFKPALLDSAYGKPWFDPEKLLAPAIRKAVKERKIFLFEHWTP